MIFPSPAMPFKQLPVLEVDGELLTQSHTIARYLARTFKIAGRNDLEAAQADAYIDIIYDMLAGKHDFIDALNPFLFGCLTFRCKKCDGGFPARRTRF